MRLDDLFYSVTTGSKRLRILLTPVGFVVFAGMLLLVIFGGLYMDRTLGLPELFSGIPGRVIGLIFLAAGVMLLAWCVVWFAKARGTPVPFNPPRELVVVGPYAWSRNPMLAGVFACVFGLGFLLHSVSMVFICTPMFVLFNLLELKTVEEPELERRFGESYVAYKRRVPMFVPRVSGVSKSKRRVV